MKYSIIFAVIGFLIQFVIGNTETFQFSLINNNIAQDQEIPANASIHRLNHSSSTTRINVHRFKELQYIDLGSISNWEFQNKYFVKVCWSAIHPVSVNNFQLFLIHDNIYASLNVSADSYPKLDSKPGYTVPINLTIDEMVLFGTLPRHLVPLILYIVTIAVSLLILNHKVNFYHWI